MIDYDAIKVNVNGTIPDSAKKKAMDILAQIIYEQFGLEGLKWAAEELKKPEYDD